MTVTEEDSRADVIECIHHVNATAKRTLRLDFIGRENPTWARLHEQLNDLLTMLEMVGTA